LLGIFKRYSASAFYRAAILLIASLVVTASAIAPTYAADRSLYLYYTHTKETAKITFKRNGRYDKKGLAQLNQFLRDWRRNEPTKMDPKLFDLIWEVYRESGATKPVHVVSAYRSPKTNEMLRSRSSAVAKNSNHTRGLAMDFFIPGVSVSKLRQIAMKKQSGGVGYYPTSGSPFVHLDTGSVRAWPRMTTAQLKKIFPKGKTMHIPSNGVVLSKSGYAYAKAEYSRCRKIPCSGSATTRLASTSSDAAKPSGRTLLDVLFGTNKEDETKTPTQRTVAATTIRVAALNQLPPQRPTLATDTPANTEPGQNQLLEAVTEFAITPPVKSAKLQLATTAEPAEEIPSRFAVASIDPADEIANPTPGSALAILKNAPIRATISAPDLNPEAALLAAYAPTNLETSPDAQKALEIILNRQNGITDLPEPTTAKNQGIRDALATASLTTDFADFGSILKSAKGGNTKSAPNVPEFDIAQRSGEFIAPDLEHVIDLMTEPARLDASQYAVLFEPDDADLHPAALLGSRSQVGFSSQSEDIIVSGIAFRAKNTL